MVSEVINQILITIDQIFVIRQLFQNLGIRSGIT